MTAGAGVDENVVRDETALEVAPGDVRGFVAAIERLLDDDELRGAHGRGRPAARPAAQLAGDLRRPAPRLRLAGRTVSRRRSARA